VFAGRVFGAIQMTKDARSRQAFDFSRLLNGRGPHQTRLRVAPGDVICRQGDPAGALFYIEKGRAKVTMVSARGKEAMVSVRGEGEFVGSRALVARRRGFTATALTECWVVRVAASTIVRFVREEPDFAEMFVTYLVRQSIRDQQNLAGQLTEPSEERLARVLLRLASNGAGPKSHPVVARVNQADLASMVGTTRSRVNSFMNKFRKQGFIEYNRQGDVTVHKALSKALHDS
jgi:CRP/FNR family transcriptional regulator, cyclic AMP receptor protein